MKSSRDPISRFMTSLCRGLSLFLAMSVISSLTTFCQATAADNHHHGDENKPKAIGVTCWTCNKTNNIECNKGAPNLPCPIEFSVCKTVHRFNYLTEVSQRVIKQCTSPVMCSAQHVGCRNVSYPPHITECISCCDYQYCNEPIPFSEATAISLSSILTSGARALRAAVGDVILVVCLSVLAVAVSCSSCHHAAAPGPWSAMTTPVVGLCCRDDFNSKLQVKPSVSANGEHQSCLNWMFILNAKNS